MSKSRLRIPWDFLKPTRNSRKEFCHPPFIWLKSLFTMESHPFWRLIFHSNHGWEIYWKSGIRIPAPEGQKCFVHFPILHKKLRIVIFNNFCFTNQISIRTSIFNMFYIISGKQNKISKNDEGQNTQFCVKNLKMKRKKDNKCLTFWSGDLNSRFQ